MKINLIRMLLILSCVLGIYSFSFAQFRPYMPPRPPEPASMRPPLIIGGPDW